MRVIARKTLRNFWLRHGDAEEALKSWYSEVARASWQKMVDIKNHYATASVIDNERIVFNICGNKYRLVAKVWFPGRMIYVKFIGTHQAYDGIDVSKL